MTASVVGRSGGFTLLEALVVLGIMGLLLGIAVPMATAIIDADRRQEVVRELEGIAEALDAYYFDNASFPASPSANGFYAVYLQSGVSGTAVKDGWGGDVEYRYTLAANPDVATVWSRGENGVDDGVALEEFVVRVNGTSPGLRRTRHRMRLIVEALANHLEAGGTLTGTWSADRATLGLGAEYEFDGFGTSFQLTPATLTLRSAGPDRVMGNGDDLTS